ncbi:hypothetical protein ACXPWS_15725 [Mycobacterium sp. BMJ-28]
MLMVIAQSIGGALGVSVTADILTAGTDATTQVPSEAAIALAWFVCAGFSALVVLGALLLALSDHRKPTLD